MARHREDGRMLRSFAAVRGGPQHGPARDRDTANEAGASRSARTKHDRRDRKTNSRELGLSMDIQFGLQANRAYMAATHRAGVLRRIVDGPHGRRPGKRSHRRALDPARPANRGCCAYARRRQQ